MIITLKRAFLSMKIAPTCLMFFILCTLLSPEVLASGASVSLPGHELSVFWGLPFIGILLTLSVAPLSVPHFWHQNYGRISFCWALATLIPMAVFYSFGVAFHEALHTYLLHFIPFIILVGALYTISGGVRIKLACAPSPAANTLLLCVASLIASWIGTTGAAMLFIRPLLAINENRKAKTHTVIFFILLVCNIGGALTALGDPPLFLGFLNGIDFFGQRKLCLFLFLLLHCPYCLCISFLDTFYYRKENTVSLKENINTDGSRLQLSGKRNLIFLSIGIGAVLLSGIWKPGLSLSIFGIEVGYESLLRDIVLLSMSLSSWFIGPRLAREENLFSWEPLLEVAKLFAAIFITAIPVIAILQAGSEGSLSALMDLVTSNGQPVNVMYFWLTGALSAFLDNAPTYLVFFNMAGGDPATLMGPLSSTLVAISAGAVFMGALTYIGNAPNFMVRAIAESKNVPMPGFFGYMLWSCALLLPLFFVLTFVLF